MGGYCYLKLSNDSKTAESAIAIAAKLKTSDAMIAINRKQAASNGIRLSAKMPIAASQGRFTGYGQRRESAATSMKGNDRHEPSHYSS